MTKKVYNPRWTPEEDEALRMHYPLHGTTWNEWRTILHGRSEKAIANRARALGIYVTPETRSRILAERPNKKGCSHRWTYAEDAVITEHYPLHGGSWDGWDDLLPGRTQNAIRRRASDIGVHYRQPRQKRREFTASEKECLRKAVYLLAKAIGASPKDVATELVVLRRKYERGAA